MMILQTRTRGHAASVNRVVRFSVLVATSILVMACGNDALHSSNNKTAEAAPTTPETWQAMSRTATGITGDITVTPDKLVFGNGASLNIALVDQNDDGTLRLYQVTSKTNPVLLNGNLLCGRAPINYLTLEKVGNSRRADLSMTIYYYPGELRLADLSLQDQSDTTRTPCAIYNYVQ